MGNKPLWKAWKSEQQLCEIFLIPLARLAPPLFCPPNTAHVQNVSLRCICHIAANTPSRQGPWVGFASHVFVLPHGGCLIQFKKKGLNSLGFLVNEKLLQEWKLNEGQDHIIHTFPFSLCSVPSRLTETRSTWAKFWPSFFGFGYRLFSGISNNSIHYYYFVHTYYILCKTSTSSDIDNINLTIC